MQKSRVNKEVPINKLYRYRATKFDIHLLTSEMAKGHPFYAALCFLQYALVSHAMIIS